MPTLSPIRARRYRSRRFVRVAVKRYDTIMPITRDNMLICLHTPPHAAMLAKMPVALQRQHCYRRRYAFIYARFDYACPP